ncbi:hypothetical protein D3C73_1297410 [compost metagenome]
MRLGVAQLVSEGGEEPVLGVNDFLAGVEDQETAGSVGVFGFAGLERGLAEGCRLLVTEDAGNRRFPEQL